MNETCSRSVKFGKIVTLPTYLKKRGRFDSVIFYSYNSKRTIRIDLPKLLLKKLKNGCYASHVDAAESGFGTLLSRSKRPLATIDAEYILDDLTRKLQVLSG